MTLVQLESYLVRWGKTNTREWIKRIPDHMLLDVLRWATAEARLRKLKVKP